MENGEGEPRFPVVEFLNANFINKKIMFFSKPENADAGLRIVFTDRTSISVLYSGEEGSILIEMKE